jgi:very-short-patch-repair endonuclease/intein/homing endonuclease
MVTASGGYTKTSATDVKYQSLNSTANMPITKNSQFAGSGANVIFTQPMFFSPMHTPQSWQIASKRKEIYTWCRFYYCLVPETLILMSDGTEKQIKDIAKGDQIIAGDGSIREVKSTHARYIDEEILKIRIGGVEQSLWVTTGHEIPRIPEKHWTNSPSTSPSLRRKRERKNNFKNMNSIWSAAETLSIKDRLFTPSTKLGDGYQKDIFTNEMCYLIGAFLAEGSFYWYKYKNKVYPKALRFSISKEESNSAFGNKITKCLELSKTSKNKILFYKNGRGNNCVDISISDILLSKHIYNICNNADNKKINAQFIHNADKDQLLNVLAGFIDGDGCLNGHYGCQIISTSATLKSQISFIYEKIGITYSCSKSNPPVMAEISTSNNKFCQQNITKKEYKRKCAYNIRIPTWSFNNELSKFTVKQSNYIPKHIKYRDFLYLENKIYRKITSIKKMHYSGQVFDLEIDGEHSYCANRCVVHNSNEPKIGAGIDFYSEFSMNNFRLECKNSKILKYYEKVVKDLKINYWSKLISHERNLLGDVFPFLEIECPVCGGLGVLNDGSPCQYRGGKIKRILVLNPDWVEVQQTQLASEPVITLVPDEDLRKIVTTKSPKQIYDRLPPKLIKLVLSGLPIPLSNRCVSHIKYNASPYGIYGESILRRCFTMLAYKTKLMTANWIIAERLILPIRVVKIGSDNRPATPEDIADTANQLAAVANDPNLTLVTHHNFAYEFIGACHDKETEILTLNGWKKFYDINKINETVATYNLNNGHLEFQKINSYHEYDWNSKKLGKLINFKHKSTDILVTPTHRMLVKRNNKMIVVNAKDISHDDKFISKLSWNQGRIPKIKLTNISPVFKNDAKFEDFIKFIGYYLSEGSLKRQKDYYDKNNIIKTRGIMVCQSVNSIYLKEIKNLVDKLFKNYSLYEIKHHEKNKKWNNVIQITINNTVLAKYFEEQFGLSGSNNKKMPDWIKNLPKNYLKMIYQTMMNGDGGVRKDTLNNRYKYSTTSKRLADDFSEICLKIGYWPNTSFHKRTCPRYKDIYRIYFSELRCKNMFNIRKKHISNIEYNDKVYCVSVPNEFIITRRNGCITVQGNTGKIHNITNEMEQIGKEILDGLMLNQAVLNGEAASYSSSQVGVEIMIRRLESWRSELAEWIETHIFLPIAMMQGFVDKERSELLGETEYLYPTIKWNDLNLRDKSNHIQILISMHDKKLVSSQTLLESVDLNYDQEVQRLREEQVVASASGLLMGGAPGGGMPGMGGMGGMPGGLGGAPPMGGMPAGGDTGVAGTMPAGGEMGGAGAPGAPVAPIGGDMGAGAMGMQGLKVGKRSSKGKSLAEQMQAPPPQFIKLTRLEQKMYKILSQLEVPYKLFAQYQVMVPGAQQPYVIDYAYPHIGVGLESDGTIWHEAFERKARDQDRDKKLASVGWRILRFNEEAITDRPNEVKEVIYNNIVEASEKTKKKGSEDEGIIKLASDLESLEGKDIIYKKEELPNGLGDIFIIGI